MRPRRLMLTGVSKRDRHLVIADIGAAVTGLEGWIDGHTLFSNIASTFQIILPASQLAAFRSRLADTGVRLDAESDSLIADALGRDTMPSQEFPVSLNITFIHNEPDLRREVPAVPG